MKKLLSLLTIGLISLQMQAQYLKATLHMEDGTKKEGFAETVKQNDSKIRFRPTEKGDTEKFKSEDVKKINYTNKEGNSFFAERLYLYTPNIFKKGPFSCDSKKEWAYVFYDKEIKMASTTFINRGFVNSKGITVGAGGDITYFIGKKNSDRVTQACIQGLGLAIHTTTDYEMRKMAEEEFGHCPKLLESIKKIDFSPKTATEQFLEVYQKSKCK